MSKRVIQLPIFQIGFRDPSDDTVLNGGSAEFYTADGTFTTPKNAYEDINKASSVTSVTLDSFGQYSTGLYFDGSDTYDIRVKDSSGSTVYDLTSVKIPDNTLSVRTVTAASVTATIDDDILLCDTSSNGITVNLPAVATAIKGLTIKNIGAASNDVTIDANGSELIDGSATQTLTDASAQSYYSDGTQWRGAGAASGTNYTSATLTEGTIVSFSEAGGITTVDATAASKAQQETGTSEVVLVTPGKQQDHHSACKGWVNFDGTGTVAIRDDYNVSSITDNGTGDYTVNWDTALDNANYAAVVTSDLSAPSTFTAGLTRDADTPRTTGLVRIGTVNHASTALDTAVVSVAAYAT